MLGGRYLYISKVRGNDELTHASLATGCCGQCTSERLRFLSRSAQKWDVRMTVRWILVRC